MRLEMNTYSSVTTIHIHANTVDKTMVNHGDTYKKLQPNDYEVLFIDHVDMIGVIVCTTEGTQNITNYLGSCVTVMLVEIIMTEGRWHTTSHNDPRSRTTVALIGIGT